MGCQFPSHRPHQRGAPPPSASRASAPPHRRSPWDRSSQPGWTQREVEKWRTAVCRALRNSGEFCESRGHVELSMIVGESEGVHMTNCYHTCLKRMMSFPSPDGTAQPSDPAAFFRQSTSPLGQNPSVFELLRLPFGPRKTKRPCSAQRLRFLKRFSKASSKARRLGGLFGHGLLRCSGSNES